ncbi:MAG: DUF2924 domain-containing protein [Phycisphaerales bacterium]
MDVERLLMDLERMTTPELRARYAEAFGEPARSFNKRFLVRRIAWRTQALAEGGLSERATKRAEELANEADLRVRPPRGWASGSSAVVPIATESTRSTAAMPAPGTVLRRAYKGRSVLVHVRADGFEHEGVVHGSLTAVARAVTGSHWNGLHFFGLRASS